MYKVKRKIQKKWFGLYEWYSICSIHSSGYNPNCKRCNAGSWVFRPAHFINSLHYKFFPNHWRKCANKPKRRAKWLNKMKQWFPNLK
jgi:hypothetical protein